MTVIGFSAEEQHSCLQLVAAILHIGNISFTEDAKGNGQVADANPLNLAASLLSVEPFMLQNAILFRVVQTGTAGGKQSTYNVPQNPGQAAGARDALAKTVRVLACSCSFLPVPDLLVCVRRYTTVCLTGLCGA